MKNFKGVVLMEQWMEKIEKEKISSGQGLQKGETTIMFKDIADYEAIEKEWQGRLKMNYLLKFKNGTQVYLPKTVFKDLQEAVKGGAFGLRIVKSGLGIETKYATIPITEIRANK
jgi:hypothetical protein